MDEGDYTIYREDSLFAESLGVLREIRRQGRLCDIILKASEKLFEKSKQLKIIAYFVNTGR